MTSAHKIISRFDSAAESYDAQASLQAQVAVNLVQWAAPHLENPQTLLDIGAGTGLVSQHLHEQWPRAQITATDPSANMLQQAQNKIPQLRIIQHDAGKTSPAIKVDAIFSSMMLHWLPDPAATLLQWKQMLKPDGEIFAALLTENSFKEWRALCSAQNMDDGLWPMPPTRFADSTATRTKYEDITIDYPDARSFLRRLKLTGAATPRADYQPLSAADMRNLLRIAPQPFSITYEVLYIENSLQGSV